MLCSFLRRGSGDRGTDTSSLGMGYRTHGNSTKLHQGSFRPDMKKNLFTVTVVKHCNGLPCEEGDAQRLSVFQKHLNNVLSKILEFLSSPEVVRQLDSMIFVGPIPVI